jgi:alpha-amylase
VTSVVLYAQVHQPWRIRPYSALEVGASDRWFDDRSNRRILRRVAERCYVPATRALRDLVDRHDGAFRCALSLSGTVLAQMERWAPSALASFRRLVRTGCVEVLAETSHHSLASIGDEAELVRQVRAHAAVVEATFGRRPTTFRNTELILDNGIARVAERLGFSCVLAEGADRLLRGRSPHVVYRVAGTQRIRCLLRDHRPSDDVAFRFSDGLTAERFADGLAAAPDADVVGLFLDFETFGEHRPASSGILAFLDRFPAEALARGLAFATPSEAALRHAPRGTLDARRPFSWADTERDVSAWLGNPMQRAAHAAIHALGPAARREGRRRPHLLERWRRLTTSDHFYYMATKWAADGDVHTYFSPWASPHDAYVAYMHVLQDLAGRLRTPAGRWRPGDRGDTLRAQHGRATARAPSAGGPRR